MVELASQQPGFLGVESVRATDGFGITVSYWTSGEAIAGVESQRRSSRAQEKGKQKWYEHYELRVAKVKRAYAKPSA